MTENLTATRMKTSQKARKEHAFNPNQPGFFKH